MGKPPLVVAIACVIGGIVCGSEAHQGDRIIPIQEISDEDLRLIDLSDGSLEEWEEILGGHALIPLDFHELLFDEGGIAYDPADVDFQAWLGWNQTSNLLLCAVMVVDDEYMVYEYDDLFVGSGYDMVQLCVDGDHSGGPIHFGTTWLDEEEKLNNNRTAQYYRVVPVAPNGRSLEYYGAGDDWVCRPPYADAGGSALDGAPVSLWSVEFHVTPFDDLIWDRPAESRGSTLYPGKIIGLNLVVADGDNKLRGGRFYSLSPSQWGWMTADAFVDAILVGSGGTGSSVGSVTWGRIKASFR